MPLIGALPHIRAPCAWTEVPRYAGFYCIVYFLISSNSLVLDTGNVLCIIVVYEVIFLESNGHNGLTEIFVRFSSSTIGS